MFCSICGKQVSDNAKWCPYCGQKQNVDVKSSAIAAEVGNNQQQAVDFLQASEPQRPFYQSQMNYGLDQPTQGTTGIVSKGFLGILGASIFIVSILVCISIVVNELKSSHLDFDEILFYLKRPYIELLCVGVVALLLVILSCSKTVLLAVMYSLFIFGDLFIQYLKIPDRYKNAQTTGYMLAIFCGIVGLILLIVNVFKDKRKQKI